MGFMFFPDMQLATNEIFRVCKDGGKVAISVWANAEQNEWYTTAQKILLKYIELPQPSAGAPGMFRCSKPGVMKQLFENAGFKNVKEESLSGKVDFGTIENYWLNRTEISEPIVNALSKIDEATRKKIKDELHAACDSKLTNGKLIMHYSSIIISAEK